MQLIDLSVALIDILACILVQFQFPRVLLKVYLLRNIPRGRSQALSRLICKLPYKMGSAGNIIG